MLIFTNMETIFHPDSEAVFGLAGDRLQSSGQLIATDGDGSPLLGVETLAAFQQLADAAWKDAGLRLHVESGYRPFTRQLSIWNRKAQGLLPLLNDRGDTLDRNALDDDACVDAILAWSALPGTSRHHWGCDLDVVDAAAIPPGYDVQLTPAECSGIFAPLHTWLDSRITRGEAFGFRRVYQPGRGRVRPEPWHLTYAPAARRFERAFDASMLPTLYEKHGLELRHAVLKRLPTILADYCTCYFGEP